MGIIKKLKGKSRQEKEIEREIRYKKAKSSVKNYIAKLEKLQKMVYEQGRQAARINDGKFMRRQASKYLVLQERVRKGQKMLLLMEEAKLQREMVKISGDFVGFAKDIGESIVEGPEVKDIAKMQVDFERAMQRAEGIDEALSVALDMASEGILSSEDFSESSIDSIVGAMEGDVETEEEGLDERISKGVKEVEKMMRTG